MTGVTSFGNIALEAATRMSTRERSVSSIPELTRVHDGAWAARYAEAWGEVSQENANLIIRASRLGRRLRKAKHQKPQPEQDR